MMFAINLQDLSGASSTQDMLWEVILEMCLHWLGVLKNMGIHYTSNSQPLVDKSSEVWKFISRHPGNLQVIKDWLETMSRAFLENSFVLLQIIGSRMEKVDQEKSCKVSLLCTLYRENTAQAAQLALLWVPELLWFSWWWNPPWIPDGSIAAGMPRMILHQTASCPRCQRSVQKGSAHGAGVAVCKYGKQQQSKLPFWSFSIKLFIFTESWAGIRFKALLVKKRGGCTSPISCQGF